MSQLCKGCDSFLVESGVCLLEFEGMESPLNLTIQAFGVVKKCYLIIKTLKVYITFYVLKATIRNPIASTIQHFLTTDKDARGGEIPIIYFYVSFTKLFLYTHRHRHKHTDTQPLECRYQLSI